MDVDFLFKNNSVDLESSLIYVLMRHFIPWHGRGGLWLRKRSCLWYHTMKLLYSSFTSHLMATSYTKASGCSLK